MRFYNSTLRRHKSALSICTPSTLSAHVLIVDSYSRLEARSPVAKHLSVTHLSPNKFQHEAKVQGPEELINQLTLHGLTEPKVKLSPLAHVNIPLNFRIRSHIPDNTSYFAFVYPATFKQGLEEVAAAGRRRI